MPTIEKSCQTCIHKRFKHFATHSGHHAVWILHSAITGGISTLVEIRISNICTGTPARGNYFYHIKGRIHSEASNQQNAAANIGKIASAETRLKMSLAPRQRSERGRFA